ncbi:hypothetical protein AAY473_036486 [Plecturocebus cupreus]
MNSRSEAAKSRANQGAISTGSEAASTGPRVKPSEKATPMTAMPWLWARGEPSQPGGQKGREAPKGGPDGI